MPKKLTTKEFIEKAKKIHGNKYDYTQVNYINTKTPILIFCKECNDSFKQCPGNHLCGQGCPKCGIIYQHEKQKLTLDTFINRAKKIHENKYDYSQVIYIGMHKKVKIICKNCKKEFNQDPHSHLKGHGCPYCNCLQTISKSERIIKKWFINNNINYISQKRFKECKDKYPLSFDFYLPDYNICIEFQGAQHYNPNFYLYMYKNKTNALKYFELQQKHDEIKKNYCIQNNIPLIEIKYTDDIELKLKELFYV